MMHSLIWLATLGLGAGAQQMTRDEAIRLAEKTVAAEPDGRDSELEVRRVEALEWPDSSLGCPEEGETYSEGAVSGYRVFVQAGESIYRVHVADDRAVICGHPRGIKRPLPERTSPPPESSVTGEVPEHILDAIRSDLLERIDAPADAVELVRAESVVWNDGSLGCAEPGVVYTQAQVAGYHVIFEHDGKDYDYRATNDGYFKLCELRGKKGRSEDRP